MSSGVPCGFTKEYREQLRERIENCGGDRVPLSFDDALILLCQIDMLEKAVDWLVQRASKEACPSSAKAIKCDNADLQNCAACWRKAVEEICKK